MDKAKSVIAKLKNKSMRTGKSLQLYLQLLCQEELLRKVSLSEFKNQLVLKGGLFIYTFYECDSFDRIMNLKNNAVIKSRWQSFLIKQKLEQFEFEEVLNDLQIFLQDIADHLIDEKSIDKKWDPREFKWN